MPSFITSQVPLAPYTTLGVGGPAEFFASVGTHEDLRAAVLWARAQGHKITILGGGSNMLVSERGVHGFVIHLTSQNVVYVDEGEYVQATADAGVVLDELIKELVEKELWGLENLSAIPGTVGAVPVQNVGAYGVEGKDVITSVCAYDIVHDVFKIFSNTECAFAYRDSFFKKMDGAKYIITSVTFKVSKSATPRLAYKDISEYFGANAHPTLSEIREAITIIRSKKLPDWHTVGTAGSFFKNPIVSAAVFATLKAEYPELPGFPEQNGDVKVSLGWILDKICNLRGYREGNVGLYEKQALVLVCEKGSTAREVRMFVEKIIARVHEHIGITIEPEVRMVE
jgi:UDP-N-acetylmuramate dehydrogenase